MPPWITSLLREETPLPMPLVISATMTSWPFKADARATASPTTPAPITRIGRERPRPPAHERLMNPPYGCPSPVRRYDSPRQGTNPRLTDFISGLVGVE